MGYDICQCASSQLTFANCVCDVHEKSFFFKYYNPLHYLVAIYYAALA